MNPHDATAPSLPPLDDDALVFAPGTILSETYQVQTLLGEGGMAQVFAAQDLILNRGVAIKVTRCESTTRPSRLRLEAQALAGIRHPSLVTVHHLGIHEGREYLVMERINGVTLQRYLEERLAVRRPLAVCEVVDIMIGISEGIRAVERAGGAHRDIKPANIMLAPPNRVILMDFGVFQAEALERPSSMAGTPVYMAPEAIENKIDPGLWHLVDLYALGIVGFELLTGNVPFDGDLVEVMRQQLTSAVPDVSAERVDVPPRLRKLIERLTAKSPEDRPESAEAVLGELRFIRSALEVTTQTHPVSVLIVDDDEDMRALLEQCVRMAAPATRIATARTAEEAIARIKHRPPDALLVDLRLPGMSGLELCLYLRGAGLAERAEIVSVSAAAEQQDRDLLRRLGVSECLAKGPELVPELSRVIRRVARMHR